MSNKMREYARGAKEAVGATYDSDEDLPPEIQRKMGRQMPSEAEKTRQEAWENADTYTKIKKMLKTGWYGDKRKPRE